MPAFTPEAAYAVTTAPGDQFAAYSAQFANGGHVVVWTSGDSSNAQQVQSFAQVYDAQGNAAGAAIQLFTGSTFAAEGAAVGGVAALADGSFVVLARSEHPEPAYPPTWNFYQERVAQNGQVVFGPALVASYSSYDEPGAASGPIHVAPGGASYYVEMNLVDRYANVQFIDSVLKHYDLGGAAIGNEIRVSSLAYPTFPDAAVPGNGNVLMVSTFGRYGQFVNVDAYDASGNNVGHSQVGSSNGGEVNDFNPEIAALANGKALLVSEHNEWNANTQTYAANWQSRVVDASGQLVGGAHVLDIPASASPVQLASLSDGGVLAWWSTGSGFYAEAIGEDGTAASDIFAIGFGVTSVTATSDGGFLVESSRDGDIYEQKFDAGAGTSAAGNIDVNGGITTIPAGDYNIRGSAGLDQIAFAGAHTQYAVDRDSVSGPEGTDTLSGIERIRFGDGYAIALDVNGDAGQAYRLYQAAFDRTPDLPGLGFQMNDLDMGYSLVHVAQNFIDSPEFQRLYGPGLSNTEFITLLYRHVLNREPEQAGLDYHLNEFAQGETRAGMLTHFSEAPENQANVIGQIADGMLYVPYV